MLRVVSEQVRSVSRHASPHAGASEALVWAISMAIDDGASALPSPARVHFVREHAASGGVRLLGVRQLILRGRTAEDGVAPLTPLASSKPRAPPRQTLARTPGCATHCTGDGRGPLAAPLPPPTAEQYGLGLALVAPMEGLGVLRACNGVLINWLPPGRVRPPPGRHQSAHCRKLFLCFRHCSACCAVQS